MPDSGAKGAPLTGCPRGLSQVAGNDHPSGAHFSGCQGVPALSRPWPRRAGGGLGAGAGSAACDCEAYWGAYPQIRGRQVREFVWVVASPPWWRGPQVRAPWHRGDYGAVDVVGPVAPPGRTSSRGGHGSVHRSAEMAPRRRFGAFVYTVASQAALGGTSAPSSWCADDAPLGGRLSLGRENRLCATGPARVALPAARLAFSLRHQSTQASEKPS